MATSVVPALIDALVSTATANLASTITVLDGYDSTGNPGDFLMIGVDDPESENPANSADVAQTPATMATTRPRDEIGEIACTARAWNGQGDQKAARDAVYAITAAVESFLRASGIPCLGVTGVYKIGFGSSSQLRQQQNDMGCFSEVTFRIAFAARI